MQQTTTNQPGMAEEKHHGLFHHHDKAEDVNRDYRKEEKNHKSHQRLGELGLISAGTYGLHEKHNVKKDTGQAHRHKIEEEIAAAVGVGAGGYAFHEHHKKKEAKKEAKAEEKEAHGNKHLF